MFTVTLEALTALRTKLNSLTARYVKQQQGNIISLRSVKAQADSDMDKALLNIQKAEALLD